MRPGVLPLDQIANPNDVIRPDSVFWSTLRLAYQQRFHTALVPATNEVIVLAVENLKKKMARQGAGVLSEGLLTEE